MLRIGSYYLSKQFQVVVRKNGSGELEPVHPVTVRKPVAQGDLCSANPYTKKEAELGKVAFESRCALCHQYRMVGRVPGNEKNESPDIFPHRGVRALQELQEDVMVHAAGRMPWFWLAIASLVLAIDSAAARGGGADTTLDVPRYK